ncbi:MAG: type II toxin-antitoxin system mRNA interferase toxin, RelE/StbE family [Candidatus Chisholmbacteria bacterium]|nr:type II toxin-antitoxin system mRNA interferase toxin, RelE/StbE family [Candidatus Chisholmbacteria bacterium]
MNIRLHSVYKKSYKKRVAYNQKLVAKVSEKILLFAKDPTNPLLKDHSLRGKMANVRAFWVTGDMRIVYVFLGEDEVFFIDIGSHNQVY